MQLYHCMEIFQHNQNGWFLLVRSDNLILHKTVISFGLVAIPVALYTATQDNDVHFNQLHGADNSRVKYKKTCAHG